jgi:uncharacterized protein (DUF697 family)
MHPLGTDLHWWLRLARRLLWSLGLLLVLISLGELLRIHGALAGLHPWLGHAFLLLLAGGAAWTGLGWLRFLRQRPLRLPDLPRHEDLATGDPALRLAYRRALEGHLERLATSPVLDEGEVQALATSIAALRAGKAPPDAARLEQLERELVEPLLARIDAEAEAEIRRGTVEVVAAVALSPWRSFDALIVLARSLRMVLTISAIYGSRPTLGEQLAILKDIASAIAAVGLIGAGQKFVESLAARLPLIGRVVDDLLQGIGAGFYVNLAGWAARERCRSLQRWEPERARLRLATRIRRFAGDLRQSLSRDLAPAVWDRLARRWRRDTTAADPGELRVLLEGAFASLDGELETGNVELEAPERGRWQRAWNWLRRR